MLPIATLDAHGQAISPAIVRAALIRVQWLSLIDRVVLSRAQRAAWINSGAPPSDLYDLENDVPTRMGGFPIEIETSLPASVVEFRRGRWAIVRIENLAVPKFPSGAITP